MNEENINLEDELRMLSDDPVAIADRLKQEMGIDDPEVGVRCIITGTGDDPRVKEGVNVLGNEDNFVDYTGPTLSYKPSFEKPMGSQWEIKPYEADSE